MSRLKLTIPFQVEFAQVLFHKPVTMFGHLLTGGGIHAVFQQEKFFVEMVQGGRRAGFVLFLSHVQIRLYGGVVHFPVLKSTVVKRSGNADGTQRVEPVGILHNIQFCGLKRLSRVSTLE